MARLMRLIKIAVFVPTAMYLAGLLIQKDKIVFYQKLDTYHKQLRSFLCFFLVLFLDGQVVMNKHEKKRRKFPESEKQKLNIFV